jgi:hypothetical protein
MVPVEGGLEPTVGRGQLNYLIDNVKSFYDFYWTSDLTLTSLQIQSLQISRTLQLSIALITNSKILYNLWQ